MVHIRGPGLPWAGLGPAGGHLLPLFLPTTQWRPLLRRASWSTYLFPPGRALAALLGIVSRAVSQTDLLDLWPWVDLCVQAGLGGRRLGHHGVWPAWV